MLNGWISAAESDGDDLESFGVVIGPYDHFNQEYIDCFVSEEAFERLDRFWGIYTWGLQPIEEGNEE